MKKTVFLLLAAAGVLTGFAPGARAASHVVQMDYYNGGSYYVFSPATLTISKGDKVTWTNYYFYPYSHTATSGGSPPTPDGLWDSGTVGNGGSYSLVFSNFSAGSYPYFCGYDYPYGMVGTINVAAAPPSISITNPASGSKLLAPADISLMAQASSSGGNVTNVGFYSSASFLGKVTSPPYNYAFNNAAAGIYNFMAKALDDQGGVATSAVITVSVLTNAVLSAPVALGNGQFALTVTGIAGQTYATEGSSNLIAWFPLMTNVAPADIFSITDFTATNVLLRYYRARQDY